MPMTLSLGRLKLGTRLATTGSKPTTNTIGIMAARGLARERSPPASDGDNHGNPLTDQFTRQGWQLVKLTIGPSKRDVRVLALHVTGFFQTVAECSLDRSGLSGRPAA